MSDYRRLISYIYAYEGGIKGKNIGFAKVESRRGQCKIQVSVRKIYMGGQDICVYLLTGDREIMIGKMFLRGGVGEFRTAVSAADVAGSGVSIDACYGLTIHSVDDTWRCYTTIWEDAVAHAAAVDLEDATAEKAQEREMSQVPGSEITEENLADMDSSPKMSVVQTIEAEIQAQAELDAKMEAEKRAEAERRAEEARKAEAERQAELERRAETEKVAVERKAEAERQAEIERRAETERKAAAERKAEAERQAEMERRAETERKAAAKRKAEAERQAEMERRAETERKAAAERKAEVERQAEMKHRMEADKKAAADRETKRRTETAHMDEVERATNTGQEQTHPTPTATVAQRPKQDTQILRVETPQTPPGLEDQQSDQLLRLDQAEQDEQEDVGKLWIHFQRHYPKIQAFDYNGSCEILLIKPQDIGLLPREVWGYGNNSFLLHGYYNHRYLILARLIGQKGDIRFLLGVPGHYYSNEKYMASMFGFPNFVLSKMQPAGDGRFGYWYTDIRLGT